MNPILLQTKYFTLYTLWIAIPIAIIFFTFTIIKLTDKNHLKIQFLNDNLLGLTISALIGSRILSLILNIKTYFYSFSPKTLLKVVFIWDKGISLTGALIGGGIFLYLICKKEDQDIFKWLDVFVPTSILTAAITHTGAFFEGIQYGKETNMPWGVNFESPSVKYIVPIHPTQIYAAIFSITIFYFLSILSRNKKLKQKNISGIIALSGIIMYSTFTIINNLFRGDDTFYIFGIRINIIINIIIIIIAGIILTNRYNEHIKIKTVNNKHDESN